MILTYNDLLFTYNNYSNINNKISRDIKSGKLFPIIKGVYETDKNTPGQYLSGVICGPSYLSFDFALAIYNLIPEKVYKTYTSATFKKDRKKEYSNIFGLYTYRDISKKAYPLGILIKEENGYSYQIATPEKALCDKLYIMKPVYSIKDLKKMLFEDLRIDKNEFEKLDFNKILEIASKYGASNLNVLSKMIGGKKEKWKQ